MRATAGAGPVTPSPGSGRSGRVEVPAVFALGALTLLELLAQIFGLIGAALMSQRLLRGIGVLQRAAVGTLLIELALLELLGRWLVR